MKTVELAAFREWFLKTYPNRKLVLRRAYVEEWRKQAVRQRQA